MRVRTRSLEIALWAAGIAMIALAVVANAVIGPWAAIPFGIGLALVVSYWVRNVRELRGGEGDGGPHVPYAGDTRANGGGNGGGGNGGGF